MFACVSMQVPRWSFCLTAQADNIVMDLSFNEADVCFKRPLLDKIGLGSKGGGDNLKQT